MARLFTLIFVLLAAAGLAPAMAQAQAQGQLYVGTRFISGFCLEARGDAAVVVNKCNALPPQAFRTDDNTGYVLHGDACLSVAAKGQPLVVKTCANGNDQKWTFEDNGTLKSDSGLCADILEFRSDPGTTVIAWDCNATDNQKFFATSVRIAGGAAPAATPSAASRPAPVKGTAVVASYFVQGDCLEAQGSKGGIVIEGCARKPAQALHFQSGNSGPIVQDGKCLSFKAKGEALRMDSCDASAAQDWTFTQDGSLRNRAGTCADILKFAMRNGTDVIGWDCTGTDNQKWYPAVAAEGGTFTLGDQITDALKGSSQVTTISKAAGYSPYNITGSGGLALTVDGAGMVGGGLNKTVILGGAGVLTLKFGRGLAGPSVQAAAKAGGTDILPHDWSFFSGDTAGTMKLD
jgi:hypothetical protein